MKTIGEYLFESFEESLKYIIRGQTNYERERNITTQKTVVIVDLPDVKLVNQVKTDNSTTLIIFFKNSTKYDIWKFWIPSDNQFNFLTNILPKFIQDTELKNKKRGCD